MGTALVRHTYVNPVADIPGNHVTPTRWNGTGAHVVESVTVERADITDATATGRSVLGAADAPAIRTLLGLGTAALEASGAFDAAGTAADAIAAFAATLGTAANSDAGEFDLFGSAAAAQAAAQATAAAALAAFAGTLGPFATGTNAANLTGTLDPARIANATLPIAKLTPALATVATSGSAADLSGTLDPARIANATLPPGKLVASGVATEYLNGAGAYTTPVAAVADNSISTIKVIDKAITHAKQADMATQRVVGRNTAGSGVREEVTVSQVLDWMSSTNGAIPTRTGGTWAAAANVAIDGGDVQLADNASPSTPAVNRVKVFARNIAGRSMPAWMTSVGVANAMQGFIGDRCIFWVHATAGTNNITTFGGAVTASAATLATRAPASTGFFAAQKRVGYESTASAGTVPSLRSTQVVHWRGNAAGLGGFHAVYRFGISDPVLVPDARMFAGFRNTGSAPTNADPSSYTNSIGIGVDANDTTLQLYAAGAAAQARVSLGANFPANTVSTDFYELHLYAAPNDSTINIGVVRLNTGHVFTAQATGANLPANTTFFAPVIWRSNNATAAVSAFDISSLYIESPQ